MRPYRTAALLAAAFSMMAGAVLAQEGPPWWNNAWRYRKLVTVPLEGTRSFYVWLYAGDRALPDGRDIRAVAPDGKTGLPCSIVYSSPHGLHLVTFDDTTPAPEKPKEEKGKEEKKERTEEAKEEGKDAKDKTPKDKPGFFAIYYGNPQAPGGLPELRRGLILETRAMPENPKVDSWKDAAETLSRAKTVYGAGFWRDPVAGMGSGYNPFGAQKDYICVFRGYFESKGGNYKFATMSEDASFLLVDDQVVFERPGRDHGIDPLEYGREQYSGKDAKKKFGGERGLGAGVHKLTLVSFAFGGSKKASATWFPAGAKMIGFKQHPDDPSLEKFCDPTDPLCKRVVEGWSTVSANVFHEVAPVLVRQTECIAHPVCADFQCNEVNYLEVGSSQMVIVKLASTSTVTNGLIRSWQWDLGDGQTSTERELTHLYLVPKPHDVSLTIMSNTGTRDTFKMALNVTPIQDDLDFTAWKRNKFWDMTKDFVVDKLPTEHLLALREFTRDRLDMEEGDERQLRTKIFDICSALDKRRTELKPLQLYDVAIDLGEYYLDPLRQWETAKSYYELALNQCPEDDMERRFNARFHLADTYFYYANDLFKARKEYEALRSDFLPSTDPVRQRMALIRLGDIQRNQGKVKEAMDIYQEAEFDTQFRPKEPQAIAEGRFIHDVDSFLNMRPEDDPRSEKGKRALQALNDWLWAYPTKRTEGKPLVLLLRVNMMLGNYHEVNKQADIYLSYAHEPDFVPEAHVLAGKACLELGLKDEARKHAQVVLDEYKESPWTTPASDIIRRLGQ